LIEGDFRTKKGGEAGEMLFASGIGNATGWDKLQAIHDLLG
jgi:hypothetical protein